MLEVTRNEAREQLLAAIRRRRTWTCSTSSSSPPANRGCSRTRPVHPRPASYGLPSSGPGSISSTPSKRPGSMRRTPRCTPFGSEPSELGTRPRPCPRCSASAPRRSPARRPIQDVLGDHQDSVVARAWLRGGGRGRSRRVRRGRAGGDRGPGGRGGTSGVAQGMEGVVPQATTLLGVSQPIRAAGGIVLRGEGGDRSVALVHRPRYDDWSFPKGKLEDGEDEATAARARWRRRPACGATLGRASAP